MPRLFKIDEAITERYPPAQCTKNSPFSGNFDKCLYHKINGYIEVDNHSEFIRIRKLLKPGYNLPSIELTNKDIFSPST